MNPVVRPLMESVKKEQNQQLQEHAAVSLSRLIYPLCVDRTPSPMPKIIKNLCATLCSDSAFTPAVVIQTKSEAGE